MHPSVPRTGDVSLAMRGHKQYPHCMSVAPLVRYLEHVRGLRAWPRCHPLCLPHTLHAAVLAWAPDWSNRVTL